MPWKDKAKHNADNLARYHRNRESEKAKRNARAFQRLVDRAGRPPGDVCEICERAFAGTPHFDHNHASGEFRGWLCGSCNKALGLLQDLPDTVLKAHSYLRSRGFAAG